MSIAICIPSNRSLVDSNQSIASAIKYAEGKDIIVSVSDNSGSSEKFDFYSKLISNKFIYSANKNLSITDNWSNSKNQVSADFKSILSDDDLIFNINTSSLDLIYLDDSIVGLRPTMSLFTNSLGIYSTSNFSIEKLTAVERCIEYLKYNNGSNTTLFSFLRSWLIDDIFDLMNNYHPTQGGYSDWAVVFAYVSSGKIINDPSTHLIYNNNNWYGDAKTISNNVTNLFIEVNMPAKSAKYLPLLTALDCFILIMRNNSPLTYGEKIKAASYLLLLYTNTFLKSDESLFFEENSEVITLIDNLNKSKTVNDCIINAVNIISTLRHDLKMKYEEFYYNSLFQELGTIR